MPFLCLDRGVHSSVNVNLSNGASEVERFQPYSNMTDQDDFKVRYNDDANRFFQMRHATTHAAFFLPHLKPGMTVLDCGCGPGSITVDLAQIVAPAKTFGIDVEPKQVKLAETYAAGFNTPNVKFRVADIRRLPFPNNFFDAVFIHGVVEYLENPVDAFREVWRVLKADGVVGSRHGDWSGFLLAPAEPNVALFFTLFQKLLAHNGGDIEFGRNQLASIRAAGFKRIFVSASYDCWTETPRLALSSANFLSNYCVSSEFADPIVKLGLADLSKLQQISLALKRWGKNPNAFAAEAWGEAVAWKE
jgi:SAM-dependent methyltransferase